MALSKRKLRLRGFLLILSVLLFTLGMTIFGYLREKKRILYSYGTGLQNSYDVAVSIFQEMSDLIFEIISDNPRVSELLYTAYYSGSRDLKDQARENLENEIQMLYSRIVEHDYRQLHFHEPGTVSFLRMHKPDRYGDSLRDIRFSVAYVNDKRVSLSGFEEGRIFNGYRFVYPLSLQDETSLGSVEVSMSLNSIIHQLSDKFDKDPQFILNRRYMEERVFLNEQEINYGSWSLSDAYVIDQELENGDSLGESMNRRDRERILSLLENPAADGSPFSLQVRIQGEKKILSFIPIRNFQNQIVAWLYSTSGSEQIDSLNRDLWKETFVFSLLLFLMILFFIYYYRSDRLIENLIHFDQLTGAMSRMNLFAVLEQSFQRYLRYKRPFCLVIFDLDHFKRVNDTYGHLAGDQVLKEFAGIITRNIRKTDSFGRYGGEEFILILEETELNTAVTVVEHLRFKVEEYGFTNIGTLTVSCGIAAMNNKISDPNQLLQEADERLYDAKKSGRNRVFF